MNNLREMRDRRNRNKLRRIKNNHGKFRKEEKLHVLVSIQVSEYQYKQRCKMHRRNK